MEYPHDFNHHCLLSFEGFNWWIVSSDAKAQTVRVCRDIPGEKAIIIGDIDISKVNWEAYAKASVAWDYANYC
jgi:hypothetical protein